MKNLFTTKNISGMAVMSALAFIVYLIEMPIFASTPASFLKLDLSDEEFEKIFYENADRLIFK